LTRDGPPFVVAQVLDRGAVIAHQAMRSPSRRAAAARSRAFERRLWFVGSDRSFQNSQNTRKPSQMAVSMIGATMRLSRQRNEDQTVDPAVVAVVMPTLTF